MCMAAKSTHQLTVVRAKIQAKEKVKKYVHKEVRKLFVGGIPPAATFKEFRDYFASFGELEDVMLPQKSEGQGLNCGFGFVTFKHSEDAISVLKNEKHHTIRAKWVG